MALSINSSLLDNSTNIDSISVPTVESNSSLLDNYSLFDNSTNITQFNGTGGRRYEHLAEEDDPVWFTITVVTLAIGVAGNFIIVFQVVVDRQLHTDTFTAIAALGISDLSFVITNCIYLYMWHDYELAKYFEMIMHVAWTSSALHVVLLAAVRYIILVHPFRAASLINKKKLMLVSMAIWVFATIPVLPAAIPDLPNRNLYIKMLWWMMAALYLIATVSTATLHLVKVNNLRKCRIGTSVSLLTRRMSLSVTTVIVAFAILAFPHVLAAFLYKYFLNKDNEAAIFLFLNWSDTLQAVNSSINPIIYGLLSSAFRNTLKRTITGENFSSRKRRLRESYEARMTDC